ncbi:type II secretion system protein GspN [Xylophilus rhododendri]|uniref:Type II secretion system protein N n=1 Tax=Xylophilus rhododendri TaxID=2697032 RepID=A0A857J511_9BURK|nr:type II secretion system protein N [Xylophilus rhododendri]QHI98303.1 type II secretion system protein GspN [Xylophilus rhododendri]
MARRLPSQRTPAFRRSGGNSPGLAAPIVGAFIGLLLALLLFAPARWLTGDIASASGRHVLLADPRGTVWNGSAQLVLAGGSGSSDAVALPDRIEWQLRPRLTGLRLQLLAGCCTAQPIAMTVAIGWSGVHLAIEDSGSSWPASLLSGLGTPFNTVQPEGTLAVRTTGMALHFASGRMSMAGRADIDIQNLASSVSQLRPLGSYRLSLQGGDVPHLQLSTLGGALQLSGEGRWVGNRLRFNGLARALPEREAALSILLNLLGRRDGATSVITLG